MPRSERAKIFIPFNPLRGFHEALRERERVMEERTELPEDRLDELDAALATLACGDQVTVTYVADGARRTARGVFGGVDAARGQIAAGGDGIPLDDVVDIAASD